LLKRADIQNIAWHALPAGEVYARLATVPAGLDAEEAAARQREFGPNALPGPKIRSLGLIFVHQFFSPLIYILLAAAIVSVVIGEVKDAGFILAVILLNAGIGTHQEWKAEKSAAALQGFLTVLVRVSRAGVERQVPAEELVPGDVVFLESGNRVPADLRLVQANGLAADESLLTGESIAVQKDTAPVGAEVPVSDRSNMAFAGSIITAGRGTGIVVATGKDTEVGKIAEAVTQAETSKPPLVLRMERFSRQISFAVLGACALLAAVAIARGMPAAEVFFTAVALAVSAIPEGLPVAITIALSVATVRMLRRNVIVRKLTAVEALGSCTLIASDKTGTLTVNKQSLRLLALPSGERFTVSGEGYAGEGEVSTQNGEPLAASARSRVEALARAGIVCNEATLLRDGETWTGHGDAVDLAFLALGYKLGLEPESVRRGVTVVGEIPFESERRYAARFYREEGRMRVAVKGAIETVLPFCRTMLTEGGTVEIDPESVQREALSLSGGGFRVLAVAGGELDAPPDAPAYEEAHIPPLTLLGLVGLIDPLRPEVRAAVDKCRTAGVKVAMITGDHPATALAIARELGIAHAETDLVTGGQLDAAGPPDSPEFLELVKSAHVFARVTPLQKLHIVDALIQAGHYVAVTGDGVNDAPAMRKANIGVAMGSGTDVAKDTAAIIVTDDNFASIEAGVEEGRYAYDNIRKVIYLLVATGAAEVVLITLALLFGLPLPLVAVQLLWLNLVTNGIQHVGLAVEGGEPETMTRPPRKPTEGVFNRLMVQQLVVASATMGVTAFGLWYWLLASGWEEAAARNMVLLLMVFLENFHVFNCRSEYRSAFRVPLTRNLVLVAGVLAAQGIHILAMHIPFMQSVLRVAPVSTGEWLSLFLLASVVLVVMELFKLAKRYSSSTITAVP